MVDLEIMFHTCRYSSSSPSTFITALPEDFYSFPKMDFSNNSNGFLLLTFPQFPRKYSTSLFSIARSSLPLWSLQPLETPIVLSLPCLRSPRVPLGLPPMHFFDQIWRCLGTQTSRPPSSSPPPCFFCLMLFRF